MEKSELLKAIQRAGLKAKEVVELDKETGFILIAYAGAYMALNMLYQELTKEKPNE